MAIEKPKGIEQGATETAPALEGKVLTACPTLVEYLALERYADGTPRERSTMNVFIEGGQVKLCLNDRDTGRTAWVSGVSLEAALKSLEDRLSKGTADWRPGGSGAKRGRR